MPRAKKPNSKTGKPGKTGTKRLLTLVRTEVGPESLAAHAEFVRQKPQARDRFEVLFENANDALMVIDLESKKMSRSNQQALELTGYLREELEGSSVDLLFPKEIKAPEHSHPLDWIYLETSGFFEDVVLRRKDGYLRFVSLSVNVFTLDDRTVSMCILRDVSEKKNMERELITKHAELRNAIISLEKANADLVSMQDTLVQSGKMAALGELAAGIAHELNQPLTAVAGFAEEAQEELEVLDGDEGKKEVIRSFLSEIIVGSRKMEKIIGHLRNFTRRSTEDFAWVNIHTIIDESLFMLDKQFKSRGISVDRQFAKDLPEIHCNPFQIEQVFINFATNARDAIEAKKSGGGNVVIRTRLSADNFIEIQYEDDGVGMGEAVKTKIFNPFFTTKEVGKGMGLGLSISYGILAKINASILVESKVGKGTKFTVKLPIDYRKH